MRERIAKLTKRTVDAAEPESERYILWATRSKASDCASKLGNQRIHRPAPGDGSETFGDNRPFRSADARTGARSCSGGACQRAAWP